MALKMSEERVPVSIIVVSILNPLQANYVAPTVKQSYSYTTNTGENLETG